MSLDIAQIDHLAKLSRLALSEDEKKLYTSQLESVFEYFNKLQAIDTTSLEPLSQVVPLANIFRADEAIDHPSEAQQKIIDNAPGKSGRHIRVQKILWVN